MKHLSALAAIIACALAIPQGTTINPGGPAQFCTYTTVACTPPSVTDGVETITVYEDPYPATVTQSVDCEGCSEVSVVTDCTFNLFNVTSITTVTEFESTSTVDVCSPTP